MSLPTEDAILRACNLYTLTGGAMVVQRHGQYGPEVFALRNLEEPGEPVTGWGAKLGDFMGSGVSVKAALNALVDALEVACERTVGYHEEAIRELTKEGFASDLVPKADRKAASQEAPTSPSVPPGSSLPQES